MKNSNFEPASFHKRIELAHKKLEHLYRLIYGHHPDAETGLSLIYQALENAYVLRSADLLERDHKKELMAHPWYVDHRLCGMSLYVDRFAGNLQGVIDSLDYFEQLGVNFLHLMPIFKSPSNESDGGYAVSDFKEVDPKFGTKEDLQRLQQVMLQRDMYLMLDVVLNHTSSQHEWAQLAQKGEKPYTDYYYFFSDRQDPDQYDAAMPEIFPTSAPGNFTYLEGNRKWVMTVFHHYQWDLNYRNPLVFVEMLSVILYYANLGVDLLRIDAPAFIWKEKGTTCQNLWQAHVLLRLIRQCVQVVAPGMALLGEAIVAPRDIMPYFGTEAENECHFLYNATQMAVQWDALATGDTRVMSEAQGVLFHKIPGCTWINYTRCHDDIGLGYEDQMIQAVGFDPYQHRRFIKDYFTGNYPSSLARGALFSANDKTGDARISGSLASLCGLEVALERNEPLLIKQAIDRILLMQSHSIFLGGLPMLFYGDEQGVCNDYSYQNDPRKNYDNRWMHRPDLRQLKKNIPTAGTVAGQVFQATKRLLSLRKQWPQVSDTGNLFWIRPLNRHVIGFVRTAAHQPLIALFNFSAAPQELAPSFPSHWGSNRKLYKEHWSGIPLDWSKPVMLQGYQFLLLTHLD